MPLPSLLPTFHHLSWAGSSPSILFHVLTPSPLPAEGLINTCLDQNHSLKQGALIKTQGSEETEKYNLGPENRLVSVITGQH